MAIEPSGWIRNRTLVAAAGGGFIALFLSALAPVWAALMLGVAGFFGLRWYLSPRGLWGGIAREERPRVELVRELLGASAQDLAALVETGQRIGDRQVRERVQRMADTANEICRQLERRPDRLMKVQRLITFYLPSALRLTEGYAALEAKPGASSGRIAEAGDMLARLEDLFGDYATRLDGPQRESLDVELRLLEQTLEEERSR